MIALAPGAPPKRRSLSVLDSVQIAQPCPADWEAMHAVEGFAYRRVRHCESCNLRVYNLSAMQRVEAEELLRASEGRMCVRLYRRHDGTVLTADCSYLRRAVDVTMAGARRMGWILACGFAAVLGSGLYAVGVIQMSRDPNRNTNVVQSGLDQLCNVRPIAWVLARLQPNGPALGAAPMPLMGDTSPLMGSPAPDSGWIAGRRGPIETIQGGTWGPTPPPTDPHGVLQIDETAAPPL